MIVLLISSSFGLIQIPMPKVAKTDDRNQRAVRLEKENKPE
jgi:hypothetical protein